MSSSSAASGLLCVADPCAGPSGAPPPPSQQHHHHPSQHLAPPSDPIDHHHGYPEEPDLSSNPFTISEARYHCVSAFERLRILREQGRFCDLILSIQGRNFLAHRCVLASCSPWFDSKLKMHKTVKEEIQIDCQNLEIFYAVLTYFYTGEIVIDRNNVVELLHLSDFFIVAKLKAHCCDYLLKNLHVRNVFKVLDLADKYNIADLQRHCIAFSQKHFGLLFDSPTMADLSFSAIKLFLSNEKMWAVVPQEQRLTFIASWACLQLQYRDDNFLTHLLTHVQWHDLSPDFICDHVDKHQLYHMSEDALLALLNMVIDKNGINLGHKYQEMYQGLQQKLIPEEDLDELNDSNSFLSIAINSAVKDLEHSEVDPVEWFLQNEPPPPPPPSSNEMYKEPVQHPTPSMSNQYHPGKQDKLKDPLDFEIVEQVINEQRLSDENSKYRGDTSNNVKRYDPKFRALNEVFRQDDLYPKYGADRGYSNQAQISPHPHPQQQQQHHHPQSMHPLNPHQQQQSYLPQHHRLNPPDWQDVPPTSEPFPIPANDILSQFPSNDACEDFAVPNDPPPTPHQLPLVGPGPSSEEVSRRLRQLEGDQSSKRSDSSSPAKGQGQAQGQPEAPPKVQSHESRTHVTKKSKLLAQHRNLKEETKDEVTVKKKKRKKKMNSKVQQVLKCADCNYTTSDTSRMKTHVKQHSTNELFKCAFCDFQSKWKKEIFAHIKSLHCPGPPFRCDKDGCSFENSKLHALLNHRLTHAEVKSIKCPIKDCDFRTKTKTRLNVHLLGHKPKFACPECGKKFATSRAVKMHAISHTTAKQYTCKECDFSSKYANHLTLHMRLHTEMAFKCDFEGCSYSTVKMSHLTAHKKTHLKDKSFVCSECSRGFVEKSQLVRHQRIHSDELPFACSICPFKTRRKDKLKSHMLRIHSKSE